MAADADPRIALAPDALDAMGPPINLFKLFARNRPMAEAMIGWGRYAEAFAYDDHKHTFSLENPV